MSQNANNNSIANLGNGNNISQSIYQGGVNLASLDVKGLRNEELLAQKVIRNEKKYRHQRALVCLALIVISLLIIFLTYSFFSDDISLLQLVTAFAPNMLGWAIPIVASALVSIMSGIYGVKMISSPTQVESGSYERVKIINDLYKYNGLTSKQIKDLKKSMR